MSDAIHGNAAQQDDVQPSVSAVFIALLRSPAQQLLFRWNWKSAITSALCRAALFYAVNRQVGSAAAIAAWQTEFVFRFITSGFYGALTQSFRAVTPAWAGMLAAMLLLPLCSHGLELLVHWGRGTSRLSASIAWSVALTVFSTAFNVYAMRRGAMLVGPDRRPFLEDLRRMPGLGLAFLATPVVTLWRWGRPQHHPIDAQ